jgi:hypothetical protein
MNEITKLKLKRILVAIVVTTVVLAVLNTLTDTQWMLFYNGSISGTVIDSETNQPIEGAIVVGLWQLTQFLSEGYGGYAKVSLVKTDKNGKFTILPWVRFKPWKFYHYIHENAPQIAIYKPGYRFHWSSQAKPKGPWMPVLTGDALKRSIEEHSIHPAKLHKVHSDEERIQNYRDVGTLADFPGGIKFPFNHYSPREIRMIAVALEEEIVQLSGGNRDRQSILNYLKRLPN